MNILTKPIQKIAVFRALQLGDMLCAIPAMRALRKAFPHARIVLAGLPWTRTLTERFPNYFDAVVHFPGYPGLPEQPVDPPAVVAFLRTMQEEEFDLALQMQGNGTIVNPMVSLWGAKFTAGFCIPNDYCPDPELFLRYPEGISEIERHLQLMQHIGIPSQGTHLEFPLTIRDEADLESLKLKVTEKKYVCIHPGSRGAWRQWPPEYFAALGDYCIENGFALIITGTRDEADITGSVIHYMQHTPIDATGKTSLGAIGVLIKKAFALISNCTGVSHMASAFKTPSIVISMDGEPERWAPLNRQLHRTIDWTKTPDYNLVFRETAAFLKGHVF